MKFTYPLVFILLLAGNAFGELSVTNKWRIEQATHRCKTQDNELAYREYWRKAATDDNRQTLCMTEQFALQMAMEGDAWLEQKAPVFISQCRENSKKNKKKFIQCLRAGLEKITKQISKSCGELDAEGLWDQDRCQRLVSYIFVKKFENVLKIHSPLIEKITNIRILKWLFNPIVAVIVLVLFVLDFVIFIDPGNWTGITRLGLIAGPIILIACYFKNEIRFFGSGLAILLLLAGILWNHLKAMKKPDVPEQRPSGLYQ